MNQEAAVPDQFKMAKALAHPMRVSILMTMNTPRRRLSPARYSEETDERLGNVSYHFKVLTETGLIELVDTKKRRGSTEHFYEPVKKAMAWTRLFEQMSPVVRQNLAATALGGAVESIGRSVDEGTFEARPDAHLSYGTIRVDMVGWQKMITALNACLLTVLEVECEVSKRAEADPDLELFVASYLMSGWEAPPPPTEDD